jgi:uncharacterized protein
MKKILLLLFTFILFAFPLKAQDTVFPEPIGAVNDFEDLFTNEQEAELTKVFESFYQTGTGVIVVATIKDIGNYDNFYQYTLDLSNYWGAGSKDKNNGLTIILSSNLRQVRINTGTGTMAIITDDFCDDVVQNTMLPHFKNAEYYEGVFEAVGRIITKWEE